MYNFAYLFIAQGSLSKNKMNLFPYKIKHLILILISILAIGPSFFIPDLGHWFIDAGIRSAVVGGVFVLGIFVFNISEEINKIIRKIVAVIGIKV